jgi:hypothetical protein
MASGPSLLVLRTEMRHLRHSGCARHLMGHPHSADERAQHPACRVHLGLAADIWRETSRHRAGIAAVAGGAEGLLLVDGISPSIVVSLKLAWGRTPTLR